MTAMHPQPCHDGPAAFRRDAALIALSSAAHSVIATIGLWRWRRRERDQLAALNERMLRDIGLTRAERDSLVNKPFWRE